MSRATVEEFQRDAAKLLAAVERGEQFVIERGQKAVARLLPVEEDDVLDSERGGLDAVGDGEFGASVWPRRRGVQPGCDRGTQP